MAKLTRAQKKNAVRYGNGQHVSQTFDRMADKTREQILDSIADNDYSFFVNKDGDLIYTETPYSNHDME